MVNSSSTSNNKQFSNFYEIIDYIATYYILTMDFKSLSKLSDKEYCDNLVVLTSDIIQKYFPDEAKSLKDYGELPSNIYISERKIIENVNPSEDLINQAFEFDSNSDDDEKPLKY